MGEMYANNAAGKLASAITDADTTLALESGHNLPALGTDEWFRLTLYRWEFWAEGVREYDHEVVKVTDVSGDTLTVERALEGTAQAFDAGTNVEMRPTAQAFDKIREDASIQAAAAETNANSYTDAHSTRTDNPHAVTAAQVGADPEGSADTAETNANNYTDTHADETGGIHGAPTGERLAHTGDLGSAAAQDDTRYAHRSNNLSDVANAATARNNLGGNATGDRTVSTAEPSGGSNGDIWYEVE